MTEEGERKEMINEPHKLHPVQGFIMENTELKEL